MEKFVLLKRNLGDWEFLSQNRKLYLTQHFLVVLQQFESLELLCNCRKCLECIYN